MPSITRDCSHVLTPPPSPEPKAARLDRRHGGWRCRLTGAEAVIWGSLTEREDDKLPLVGLSGGGWFPSHLLGKVRGIEPHDPPSLEKIITIFSFLHHITETKTPFWVVSLKPFVKLWSAPAHELFYVDNWTVGSCETGPLDPDWDHNSLNAVGRLIHSDFCDWFS